MFWVWQLFEGGRAALDEIAIGESVDWLEGSK
jgi:hypothetical protein